MAVKGAAGSRGWNRAGGVRRLTAALLGLLLLLGRPADGWSLAQAEEPASSAGGLTAEELQEQLDALEAEEAALRQKAAQAGESLSGQQEYKAALDAQIDNAARQINLLSQKAAVLDAEIRTREDAIAARQASIEEKESENSGRFRRLQERLRAISKSGNLSVLQMLLDTESYTDLLIRAKLMETVSASDQRLMDELDAEIRGIREEKEALAQERRDLAAQREEYAAVQEKETDKKWELETLSKEAAEVMEALEAELGGYNERLETIRQEEEAMDQLIEDLLNSIPPATTATAAPTTTTTTAAVTTTTTTQATAPTTTSSGQTTGTNGTTAATTTTTNAQTTTTTAATTGPGGQLPTTPGGLYDSGTMYWPVPTVKYVSSFFGGSRNHKGIDIANSPTTPVYGEEIVAARDGTVIYANYTNSYGGGYGYYCIVDHGLDSQGKRIVTLYAHMSKLLARVGDTVAGGRTVLGQAGDTGNVTGPHLHFEVREDNVCVDPFANGYLIRK